MFERPLENMERLLDNPAPQHNLGVGRWGKEGDTMKDIYALSTTPETDAPETDLDADVSVDTE